MLAIHVTGFMKCKNVTLVAFLFTRSKTPYPQQDQY